MVGPGHVLKDVCWLCAESGLWGPEQRSAAGMRPEQPRSEPRYQDDFPDARVAWDVSSRGDALQRICAGQWLSVKVLLKHGNLLRSRRITENQLERALWGKLPEIACSPHHSRSPRAAFLSPTARAGVASGQGSWSFSWLRGP